MDHVTSRGPARDDRSAWAEPGVEHLGGGLYRIPLPLPNDGLTARAKVQHPRALGEDPDPDWAGELVAAVATGMAGPVYRARVNPGCRTCPVASCCPVQADGAQVGG